MKNKDSKARMQVIFGVMLFTLILTAELYMMINFPDKIIVIAGMAVVDLLCMYVVIDGLVDLQRQRTFREEEQYESVFKSQKASYLMLKKFFKETENKLEDFEFAARIPKEEIINAQKGIARVIISRSHEDTQALMGSYEELKDQIEQFQKEVEKTTGDMRKNYEEVLEQQKSTESSAEKGMQNMMVALKDMELRLNSVIMQVQGNRMRVQPEPVQEIEPEPEIPEGPVLEESDEYEGMSELETELELELEAKSKHESELEVEIEPDEYDEYGELPEAESEMDPDKAPVVEEPVEYEELLEPEEKEEIEPEPEVDQVEPEAAPIIEEKSEPEPEPTPEPVEEEEAKEDPSSMPDLSDPNKSLSPDEIAALFANVGA